MAAALERFGDGGASVAGGARTLAKGKGGGGKKAKGGGIAGRNGGCIGGGIAAEGGGIAGGSAPKLARPSSSPGKQSLPPASNLLPSSPGKQPAPHAKAPKRKGGDGGSANAKSRKSFEDWVEESGCSSDEEGGGQGGGGAVHRSRPPAPERAVPPGEVRTGGAAAGKRGEGARDDVILIDD